MRISDWSSDVCSSDLLRDGICGRFDLSAIGRLDTALQWQRPPARRQPGIADGVAAGRLMRAAGDAEGAAHDDRAPGDGALVDGTPGAPALADRARALRLQAAEEIGRAHV